MAARLERMQDIWRENNPSWRGRIEVVYASASGLANLRIVPPRIHVISAGKPFHVINAGTDWIITPARHHGIVLVGPLASEVVPDTSFDQLTSGQLFYRPLRQSVAGSLRRSQPLAACRRQIMFLNDCHLSDQLICGILMVPLRLRTSSVREPKANRNGSEAEGECLHQDSNPGPTD
jgi:hypothetical protein